jgi:hypothetical protein
MVIDGCIGSDDFLSSVIRWGLCLFMLVQGGFVAVAGMSCTDHWLLTAYHSLFLLRTAICVVG